MIYLLIPVYNEAENIPGLLQELVGVLPDQEKFMVFSDDGSRDDSVRLIHEQIASTGLRYQVLSDGINRGPGGAFNIGINWILEHAHDDDVVVTLEADCTSDITLVPRMVAIHRLGYDLVLASVYAQGGGFSQTTFFRKLVSSAANLMFRFIFNIQVLTISSFFRVYGVRLLRRIKQQYGEPIDERGFICMLEILVKAIFLKASIIEVPMVLHSSKRKGQSKMKVMKTMWEYMKFLVKSKKYKIDG